VKTDPDRKYYLPGEDATITISADYLFGKPVRNANVRLVNQQNRHWDFKEQKWVTEESNPIEGTFDKEGRFEAKVDLQDEFKDFNPEDYSHYEDLTFAAYVTDLSTKRTEQRRFRIRLTERPIQLYVTRGDSWSAPDKHPSLYVTSSYADGTPASVSGTLYFAEPNNTGEFEKAPWQGGRSKVLTFHTNRFGVGKITLPRIRDRFLVTPRNTYRYYYSYSRENDHYRNALATSSKSPDAKERDTVDTSVARALSYLDDRISEWQDPYLVGNYAIAAIGAKRQEHIANARELLARLAHNEGSTTYWNLEANTTPFYGWGTAGRLETTALAVEALAKLESLGHDPVLAEQVNRGLQYLLTHKDRYACWYSTQATQNVIEAMIATMPVGKNGTGDAAASVLVNGTKLADIKLPKATEVVGPRVIDFGKELKAGSNRVAIQRAGDNSAMQTNVITSYYIPWPQAEATQTENFKSGDTRALKLKVDFDGHEAKVGEALACRVEVERVGFAGYGMMIAEIGLPPGVEVDRESLEEAKQTGVDGYEVQPDRVVFYLWPSAGGSKFQFVFRPRFGICGHRPSKSGQDGRYRHHLGRRYEKRAVLCCGEPRPERDRCCHQRPRATS